MAASSSTVNRSVPKAILWPTVVTMDVASMPASRNVSVPPGTSTSS